METTKVFKYSEIKPGTKKFIAAVTEFCDGYYFHPYSTQIPPIETGGFDCEGNQFWYLYKLPNGKIVKESLNKVEPDSLTVTIWDSWEEYLNRNTV